MTRAKSILVFCSMIPAVISCKSDSSKSQLKVDIHEVDQSVRVIYREGNTVFLVTCPLENGEVNDHIGDEKILGRVSCNDKTAAKDANGKLQVQTMPFDSEYEPKLKKAIAVQGITNKADIDALKAKIAEQQKKLEKLDASRSNPKANSDLLKKQYDKVNQNLEVLKTQLGPDGDAETKVELLNLLISYLDVNSQVALNIAESEAGQLLAPFCSPNSLGMEFCRMGSPKTEGGSNPQDQVTLKNGDNIPDSKNVDSINVAGEQDIGARTDPITKTSRKADGTVVTWTRDTSNPELGEAWRDPSGMIWGDVKRKGISQDVAIEYCTRIGAKLPSKYDFIRLREYLGAMSGSIGGYDPQDVLPNSVKGINFWSSTGYWYGTAQAYYFNARTGELDYEYIVRSGYFSARCVSASR